MNKKHCSKFFVNFNFASRPFHSFAPLHAPVLDNDIESTALPDFYTLIALTLLRGIVLNSAAFLTPRDLFGHISYLHAPAQMLIKIYPKIFRVLNRRNCLPTYYKRWLHCLSLLTIFLPLPATND